MRFAYIDSNGNEVPIPSVDALALRIELGAIDEHTELYDAQADQWGPAHAHEIFHTLSRAAEEGEQGFVAPPPPVPQAPVAEEPTPAGNGPANELEVAEEAAVEEPEDLGLTLSDPPPDAPADEDAGLGLTLADAPPAPAEEEGDAGFDLDISADMADAPLEGLETASGGFVSEEADGAAFDFGDVSGGLEMEGSFGDDAEPAMDFGMGLETAGDFTGGLEQPMGFTPDGMGSDSGETLDLEQPMSEFSPETPPAWMEPEDVAASGDDVMDFSSLAADAAAPDEVGADPRHRRAPKDKPSKPKFRRRQNLVGPIVAVVVLGALAVGGYVAWPIVSARIANRGLPSETGVVIPPIPESLMPQMRAVADAAFATAFVEARSGAGGAVASSPENWLAGRYFANASEHGDVEAFWSGIRDEAAAVRGIDAAAFRAAYERAMEAAAVAPDDRPVLLERAEAGFEAAERPRAETLALVDGLVDAALGLHDFLLANEDNIDYAPAASITTDPVLEARPSTPEIGAAMRERIDQVTSALDGLDYLGDGVTAEGLWAAVLRRVQEVGIR